MFVVENVAGIDAKIGVISDVFNRKPSIYPKIAPATKLFSS
jgi:hypothetical protein